MIDNRSGLPEELEELAPGPELAALLAGVDRAALSERDRVRLARARNRLASHVQAELMADLCAVAWEESPDQTGRYEWAEAEIAFALRWTAVAAGRRLAQARQLVEELPAVHAALSAGRIDMPRALVFAELAEWLPDRALARAVVDRLIDRSQEWTSGQLRARLRRLVLAVDPAAAERRCVRALRVRRVELLGNEDGTGDLWGRCLPPQDVAAVWERLTAIARAASTAGDPRSMDQLRADAFLDLLMGEGVAAGGPVARHTGGLPVPDGDGPVPEIEGPMPGDDHPMPEEAGPAGGRSIQPTMAAADPAPAAGSSSMDAPARSSRAAASVEAASVEAASPAAADQAVEQRVVWPARSPEPEELGPREEFGPPAVTSSPPAEPLAPRAVHPAPRRGVVELQVPLTTLLGLRDLPGELSGFGPVVADIARQVAAQQQAGTWRYSVTNDIGEVICHGITRARPASGQAGRRTGRRPTAEVAAFIRARDRTCVAPGCRRAARGCDLDHTVDWAQGGESEVGNLGVLCRRHHRFKHAGGAEVIQPSSGVFAWTTPRGLQYVTTPDAPALDDPHGHLPEPASGYWPTDAGNRMEPP